MTLFPADLVSKVKRLYQMLYDTLCGRHPQLFPWHFQWLSSRSIVSSLRKAVSLVTAGNILDVGCGTSPYRDLLPAGTIYTGIDIEASQGKPDIIIAGDKPWPLADSSYDTVLCTQVLEHVEDKALLLSEIRRVLKPGGLLILSVPFVYNEHGMPWDYRRFTVGGLTNIFKEDYEAIETSRSSKAGTVLTTLFLIWVDESMSICRAVLLPFWIPFSFLVNIIGLIIDALDRTNSLYLDAVLVARRTA